MSKQAKSKVLQHLYSNFNLFQVSTELKFKTDLNNLHFGLNFPQITKNQT